MSMKKKILAYRMLASRCHVDSFICNRRSEEIAIILPEWQELEEVWGHIVD
jgi:hypothetical protein